MLGNKIRQPFVLVSLLVVSDIDFLLREVELRTLHLTIRISLILNQV